MFEEICPELGLEYTELSEKAANKHHITFMTIKNHEVF